MFFSLVITIRKIVQQQEVFWLPAAFFNILFSLVANLFLVYARVFTPALLGCCMVEIANYIAIGCGCVANIHTCIILWLITGLLLTYIILLLLISYKFTFSVCSYIAQ